MQEPRQSTTSSRTSSTSPVPSTAAASTLAPTADPTETALSTVPKRPVRPRAGTNGTLDSAYLPEYFDATRPPPLDFRFRAKKPLLYLAFLLTCNVLIPCLLYYLPRIYTTIDDKELIGIGSASLGLSSCFDAPFRMFRLTKHRKKYGPLYYAEQEHLDPTLLPAGHGRVMRKMPRNWWHLDFTMWTYQIGLFFFAIPLAIAPAIPLYNFFLFSTAMLIAPMGIVFILTLKDWHALPFWMSSDPPRTRSKPACYYVVEDVGAVDFGHGRAWRKRMQARWAASPPFRSMCWYQTLYWSFASMAYVGITAAIIWAPTPLDVAYGLVLGIFFAWAIVAGFISYLTVHFALRREKKWWTAKYAGGAGLMGGAEVEGGLAPLDGRPEMTEVGGVVGGSRGTMPSVSAGRDSLSTNDTVVVDAATKPIRPEDEPRMSGPKAVDFAASA